MAQLFHTYLYNPIFQALVFIYERVAFHDLGLAIIILTVLVRVVLFPLFYKGAKDQTVMQRLQPEIKRVQSELKENKEEQAKALFALYKENKINPLSGVFLLFIQLPVIIALYRVFLKGLGDAVFYNKHFLGLIDLGVKNLILAFVAAGLQYIQAKLSLAGAAKDGQKDNPAARLGNTMLYVGPILTLTILGYLPGAIGLYWVTSTIISIAQQLYINKKIKKTNGSNTRKNTTHSEAFGPQES